MGRRTGIVLQARFGSSRLPGKALAAIGGVSILERCLNRLTLSGAGPVVLATTERPEDDALAACARRMGAYVHRGSDDDVLGRFLGAALALQLDVAVRATGDNPAVDIEAPQRVLAALGAGAGYAAEWGLPYGGGVEAVSVPTLRTAAALATAAEDREHVTTYIKARPERFRLAWLPAPAHLEHPDLRVTVDTADDLDYMRRVFARAGSGEPTLREIIAAAGACHRSDAA